MSVCVGGITSHTEEGRVEIDATRGGSRLMRLRLEIGWGSAEEELRVPDQVESIKVRPLTLSLA